MEMEVKMRVIAGLGGGRIIFGEWRLARMWTGFVLAYVYGRTTYGTSPLNAQYF
jgi:hypothetical protein